MFDRRNAGYLPTGEDMQRYVHNPLWEKFHQDMKDGYHAEPVYAFSRCSYSYGWNVKFKRGSKTICTVYPREGYFIVLLVIGAKQKERFEELLDSFTYDIQKLYAETKEGNGQKWLMIEVEDDDRRYEDINQIIKIRNS